MSISARNIILFIYTITFINTGLIEILPVLSPLKFLSDVLIFFLVYFILMKRKVESRNIFFLYIKLILFFLFATTFISYFFHYENVLFYFWGTKNLFKYFIFWFACVLFLKKEDFFLFVKINIVLLFINTLIMTYQGLILQLYCDNVGGLWGTITGVNLYTNIHLLVTNIIAIVLFTTKRTSFFFVLLIILCSFLQAAVAELKFFFIEFLLIILLNFIICKNKLRSFSLISIGIICLSIGFIWLLYFYDNLQDFFNLSTMLSYSEESYAARGSGLDRTTALPLISTLFLTSIDTFLFGIGLGNAEFTTLYTPYFVKYYGFYNQHLFSHAMLFLETGLIGLILYCSFFIMISIHSWINKNKIECCVSFILSTVVLVLISYNQSMRLDSALLVFPFLAFPFISSKRLDTNKK